jgi:DNA-binding IclR family transcriptional regulator
VVPGMGLRIGSAFPLRAPFGAAAVAWAEPRAVTAWLAPLPPERREHHRAALETIRRRGYVVELAATPADRVRDLLDELRGSGAGAASDDPPTRELLERLAGDLAQGEEYLAAELDARAELRVTAINAPVRDHTGQVVLVLSLNGMAAPIPAAEVERLGARLVDAAAELSHALGAPTGSGVPGWRVIGVEELYRRLDRPYVDPSHDGRHHDPSHDDVAPDRVHPDLVAAPHASEEHR